MSEWSTYTLSDFMLFSPDIYYRLFALYNAEMWPLQLSAVALGVALLVSGRRGVPWAERFAAAILAGAWAWVAWGFHYTQYATINWAASWFALAFAVQAGLILWSGVVRGRLGLSAGNDWRSRAGMAIVLFSLLVYPLISAFAGRSFAQAEVFGVTPDPTVFATLGLILMARKRNWLLLPIPLAWCVVGGATLWAMSAAHAALLPLVGLVALALHRRRRAPYFHSRVPQCNALNT